MVIEPEDQNTQTEEVVHVQTVPQRGKRHSRKQELALAQIEVERRLTLLTDSDKEDENNDETDSDEPDANNDEVPMKKADTPENGLVFAQTEGS